MSGAARVATGVCGGLLLAMAATCLLGMLQVELRQTGGSPGKWIFLGTWLSGVGLACAAPARLSFLLLMATAGGGFLIAALLALFRGALDASPATREVTLILLALGVTLGVASIRGMRRPASPGETQ